MKIFKEKIIGNYNFKLVEVDASFREKYTDKPFYIIFDVADFNNLEHLHLMREFISHLEEVIRDTEQDWNNWTFAINEYFYLSFNRRFTATKYFNKLEDILFSFMLTK